MPCDTTAMKIRTSTEDAVVIMNQLTTDTNSAPKHIKLRWTTELDLGLHSQTRQTLYQRYAADCLSWPGNTFDSLIFCS